MDLEGYLEKERSIQRGLLDYLEKEDIIEENYQNLLKLIKDHKIQKDRHELRSFLNLISKVSNNHHRTADFFSKIEKLIQFLENQIKQTFSNTEIFDIFKNNKRFLLFLIEQQIIKVDKAISNIMILPKYEKLNYPSFFLNDIKKNVNKSKIQKFLKNCPEDLEERRKICENDSVLCEIIRNDSIDDFTSFISKENISLSSKIERSIFETNPFLLKNDPTLIEYAAFYGSIQIFNYLQQNNVELTKNLWLYSIHSQNFELIHFLEKNKIVPEDETYEKCIKEAIKCHHIEIADYIKENLIPKEENPNGGEPRINRSIKQSIYSSAIRYYNYIFFENYFRNNLCFVRFCQYGYYKIVELTLKNYEMNVNYFVVLFIKFIKFSNKKNFFIEFKQFTSIAGAAERNHFEILNLLLSQPEAKIRKDTFKYCKNLTEITIPANIKVIEKSAFKGCSSLSKVSFSSSLESIEDFAFDQCSALEELTIPSSVENIGRVAFQGCTSLKKVTFEYPSTLKVISGAVFAVCSSLKEVKLPSSITLIEKSAFSNCSQLKMIYIPPSVTEIGDGAFGNCSSLKKVSFSNNSALKVIKTGAFKNCTSLIKIKIPQSVTMIGDKVFDNCTSLAQILIPPSLTSFKEDDLPPNAKVDKYNNENNDNQ